MSVGNDQIAKKKAMWLYPKVLGYNPSERWGHSACFSNGSVYVFGGCCGGLHYADVLTLNLDTMGWNTLVTVGYGPGPRDSHSAVLVGHRMMVFGGTNGSKKVNDLHVLDLRSKEWTRPECAGEYPSPRESHSATLVGDDKLVIFGGSGEGESNYLNDLHILDLKAMKWTSPEVKGTAPVPRDSHSAIAVGSKLFVYGGDSGDRYHGDVDVFDMETLTWSRLVIQGFSPGIRAGHAAVSLGTRIYVIGGVGDKHYYNDVWVLDVSACSWTQLEICGQQPQGRFSHTAVVANSDIAIYGGCGEDERPLNELLVLQLGAEHPNGRYNISLSKIFGHHLKGSRRFKVESENCMKAVSFPSNIIARKKQEQSLDFNSDILHPKRRRTSNLKAWEISAEPEEHSLSLSQSSSPSQSDQEQTPVPKAKDVLTCDRFALFKKRVHNPGSAKCRSSINDQTNPQKVVRRSSLDHEALGKSPSQQNTEQLIYVANANRQKALHPANGQKFPEAGAFQSMIGADISGTVDGVFDSGYLMTAMVNGRLLRGVLFAPGPGVIPRGPSQISSPSTHTALAQAHTNSNQACPTSRSPEQLGSVFTPESTQSSQQIHLTRRSPIFTAAKSLELDRELGLQSDLQGVVLTLGGPGSC